MRVAAHLDQVAVEQIFRVVGMQRLDLRVLCAVQIIEVVALNRLVEKGQAQGQH
jgi:hypothetical protein